MPTTYTTLLSQRAAKKRNLDFKLQRPLKRIESLDHFLDFKSTFSTNPGLSSKAPPPKSPYADSPSTPLSKLIIDRRPQLKGDFWLNEIVITGRPLTPSISSSARSLKRKLQRPRKAVKVSEAVGPSPYQAASGTKLDMQEELRLKLLQMKALVLNYEVENQSRMDSLSDVDSVSPSKFFFMSPKYQGSDRLRRSSLGQKATVDTSRPESPLVTQRPMSVLLENKSPRRTNVSGKLHKGRVLAAPQSFSRLRLRNFRLS